MQSALQRMTPLKDWYLNRWRKEDGSFNQHHIQIVTPNQRLARVLKDAWGQVDQPQRQIESSNTWLQPDIYPLNLWLELHWNRFKKTRLLTRHSHHALHKKLQLLSNQQSLSIWQQIIENDTHLENTLFNAQQIAPLALNTYQLIRTFELSINEAFSSQTFTQDNLESSRYKSWHLSFERICKENYWLTQTDLPHFLGAHYFSDPEQPLRHLGLYGFQEYTPYLKTLLNQLETHDINVEHLNLSPLKQQLSTSKVFENEIDELNAALIWAKEKVSSSEKRISIAIVTPNLTERRSEILNASANIFNSNYPFFIEDKRHVLSINVSASQPLIQYPFIQQSLNLLRMALAKQDTITFTNHLISRYWKCSLPLEKRFEIRHHLGQIRPRTISLTKWHDLLKQKHLAIDELSLFSKTFSTQHVQSNQSLCHWKSFMLDVLAFFGWPGPEQLDSEEYQLWQTFLSIINSFPDQFIHLNHQRKSVNYAQAIEALSFIASQTEYQPQALSNQIQILGSLEAGGIPFDAVWLLSMHDQQWPSRAKANPFIPIHIQRRFNLPHASASRETEFTLTYFKQMMCSAEEIIVSHAQYKNEQPLSITPLIKPFVHTINEDIQLSSTLSTPRTAYERSSLLSSESTHETLLDNRGSPTPNNTHLPGGVSHFKEAALCYFRAYARYRFNLPDKNNYGQGLSPAERGNLVHSVLEQFWKKHHHQENLLSIDSEQLKSEIEQQVTTTIRLLLGQDKAFISKAYLNQEIKRTTHLICSWLEQEKARTAFEVISVEKPLAFRIRSLMVKARIDRIDKIEVNTQSKEASILIDYKTGDVSLSKWLPNKMIDPQLPIYLCYAEPNAKAIVFGQVKPNQHRMLWQGEDTLAIYENKTQRKQKGVDWQTIRAQWQTQIEILAEGVEAGLANTNPLHGSKTCSHCAYQGLCRIRKTELTS